MQSHKLLDVHPSVQDLNIVNDRLNPVKAAIYTRTQARQTFIGAGAGARIDPMKKVPPKREVVHVERNQENLMAAAIANRKPPSSLGGAPPPPPPVKLPALLESGSKKPKAAAQRPESPSAAKKSGFTAEQLQKLQDQAASGGINRKRKGPSSSIVTSVVSMDANSSHPDSYTEYSCSCCNPRAPSTLQSSTIARMEKKEQQSASKHNHHHHRRTPPSESSCFSSTTAAYENMTSISERMAKQQAGGGGSAAASTAQLTRKSAGGASVSSSKIRALETALSQEREDRQQTQAELARIRERQELLLSKLTDSERGEIRAYLSSSRERRPE